MSACETSGRPRVILPLPPDFATPVVVAEPREGEALLLIAARERSARIANEERLIAFEQWYENLRSFEKGQP